MPPIEDFSWIKDNDKALIIDRRQTRVIDALKDAGALILGTESFGSSTQGILASFGRSPASILSLSSGSYRRLMDHFYIPQVPDSAIAKSLFDLSSQIYDSLIDPELNLAMCLRLLKLANPEPALCRKILDLGCGTGIAAQAIKLEPIYGTLTGVDISEKMRAIAQSRGEHTISTTDWAMLPEAFWDAVISSFVVHYGLRDEDLLLVARQLKAGGLFALNYFKASPPGLSQFIERASTVGLSLFSVDNSFDIVSGKNPIMVFEKL